MSNYMEIKFCSCGYSFDDNLQFKDGIGQAVRNEKDLESLNVPLKYRSMNTFWKYYSGEAVAPYPTIFIGGNHEASNYLWEL